MSQPVIIEAERLPFVTIRFNVDGESEVKIADCEPLAVNVVVDDSITSFTYTGRHDHGSLPVLKSDGYMAQLTNALYQAKAACDAFLTEKLTGTSGSNQMDMGSDDTVDEDISAVDKDAANSSTHTRAAKKIKL